MRNARPSMPGKISHTGIMLRQLVKSRGRAADELSIFLDDYSRSVTGRPVRSRAMATLIERSTSRPRVWTVAMQFGGA